MKATRPPFNVVLRTALQKSGRRALFISAGALGVGLVMDGEYKRLFMAAGIFLIVFVAGLIAEFWRPSPIADDRPRPKA